VASKSSKSSKSSKTAPKNVKPQVEPGVVKATDGMSSAQRIVWFCLTALVFLVPIAMSNANWIPQMFPNAGWARSFALPLTYDQFDIVKVFVMRFFALAALLVWCFDFFLRGGKLRRTKLDWVILVFLGWVLITSFLSISPATAFFGKYRRFEGFFSFLTYAITFFLVVQVVDRPSRIRSLASTLSISSVFVSLYGILQYFGHDIINWGTKLPFDVNRGFSTYGNPDLLGGFLVFPLVITLAMALSEKRLGWRAFYWFAFFVAVGAWLTAFVRGAWIGGVVGLIAVIAAIVLAHPSWGVVDWIGSVATGAFSSFVIIRSLTAQNDVLNVASRVGSIVKFNEGSSLTRFEIWQAAWNSIKVRPIFGFGADTFRLVFPTYKPAAYSTDAGYLSVADNVHNYPLQLASGIGIPGFLLLYGLFGYALFLGFKNAFSRGKGTERLAVAGFWAAALGYIAALSTGLSVTGSTIFLWIALAMIVAPSATERDHKAPAWGPAVGLSLGVVLMLAWAYNIAWITADNYYLRAQFPDATGATDSVSSIKTAISLNPFNDMYRTQLGQSYQEQMLGWINEGRTQQNAGKTAEAQTDFNNAKGAYQLAEQAYIDVISFVPTEYDNYVFLSSLYNQAGSYFDPALLAKSITNADAGIAVEPFGPAIRFQKAIALWTQGKPADAAAVLKDTVEIDPNYAEPRQLYIDALKATGNLAEARKQAQALVKKDPANATYKGLLRSIEASMGISPQATGTAPASSTP
jgi:O-antigen ligase